MDGKNLKAPAVASHFGVKEQTIHHWRSRGVPDGRLDYVRRLMSEWSSINPFGPRIVLNPSESQFRRWNKASLAVNQTVEDWAINGLDQLAAEWESENRYPRVAEDPVEYNAKSSSSGPA